MSSIPTKFDVVVVGAGPSGSATAYLLAKKGYRVLMVERGRGAGSKELYGGRVYAEPLREVWPDLDSKAPIHRWVTKERISVTAGERVLTLEFKSGKRVSFTAYLTELARWMASRAEEAGALLVDEVRVDEFIVKDSRVVGVRSGSDEVYAEVVVDAEGVNRLLLERFGAVRRLEPDYIALGVKEVLKLDKNTIDERLGLDGDEGLAWVIFGDITKGIPGGGFIYTFKDTISIGIVIHLGKAIEAINKGALNEHVHKLVESLRLHPYFSRLWKDADISEYGAHLTIEGGLRFMPEKLVYPGLVIVGDAAGLLLNTGYTVRGVDFAVYSGKLAAEAIDKALSTGNVSEEALRAYEEKLKSSFVYKELVRHKGIEKIMSDTEFFAKLPRVVTGFSSKLFEADYEEPTLIDAFFQASREAGISPIRLLLKLVSMVRSL